MGLDHAYNYRWSYLPGFFWGRMQMRIMRLRFSKRSKHTFAGARRGIGSWLVQTRALQHARSSATPKATIRHSTHARIRNSNRNTHTGVRVSEPILRPLDVVLQRCSRRSRHSHSCGEGHSFFLSHDSSKPTKISNAHCHPERPTLAETSKSQICCWVSRNSHTKWTQLPSSSSAMNYDSQKNPKIVSTLHRMANPCRNFEMENLLLGFTKFSDKLNQTHKLVSYKFISLEVDSQLR